MTCDSYDKPVLKVKIILVHKFSKNLLKSPEFLILKRCRNPGTLCTPAVPLQLCFVNILIMLSIWNSCLPHLNTTCL